MGRKKNFSVVMLVSRDDVKLKKAVESVIKQEPDELRVYIDRVTLKDDTRAREILKDAGAKIFTQITNPKFDHHKSIVHNYHRALLEAENKWVIKTDDDDELLAMDRREILEEFGEDDVGIIHGDKKVHYPYLGYLRTGQFVLLLKSLGKPFIQTGYSPSSYRDVRGKIFGGTAIINQDAFAEVHPLIDHGYFYDFKTFYWILRAGWRSVYVPEVFFLQHVPVKTSKKRKSLWGRWEEMMKDLDNVSDEVVQKAIKKKSKDWRFHLV